MLIYVDVYCYSISFPNCYFVVISVLYIFILVASTVLVTDVENNKLKTRISFHKISINFKTYEEKSLLRIHWELAK